MKIKWMTGIITAALALAGIPLFGQGGTQTSTGVARVSLIRGDVSMERGDSNEWMAVTVNTPLVPGDTIATGAGSRAEVQLDYSNVVRLGDNAEVKIADLNDSRIQLQVARGTVDFAVFQNNQTNSEVDTPNVAVEPLQPGTYRIDVNSDSLSLVTVRDGQAQISTPQGSTNINAGQQITVEGSQNPQYQIVDARPLDAWDQWNRDRNNVIDQAQNYNHVNRYYTGAQDLNSSGRWTYVPGYDWCWTPYVNAGWVPYSNGRWVWEPFYGWTWVSYDSWGWAPYHYGRWFYYGSSWCWWPGAVTPYYRPLWAPAYVSFIGFGYGYQRFSFGFGYGFSSIGWCPLGPRDTFHRWWGHGRGDTFNVVNINNITNINNYYGGGRGGRGYGRGGYGGSNLAVVSTNFHVRRAIVTMPSDKFGREAVPRNRRLVNSTMLRNADVVHGTLPVVPTRASLRVTNRVAHVPAAARNRANNTRFFTRRAVATPGSNRSFNNQAASIRRMVETHNVRAPGANRAGTSAGASSGFQMSRPTGPQNQSNAARRNPAPVIRENPQGRQNAGSGNGRSVQANRPNMRRFGTRAPADAQARGNQGRQNSAQVVRENPQQRQGGTISGRGTQANRPGFRHFGAGAPAAEARGNQGRQNSAPVIRQNPQPRQNVGPRSGQPQSSRPNMRSFSGNSPAETRAVPNQSSQRFNQGGNTSERSQQNNGNFRRFTPQPAPRSAPQSLGQFNNNSGAAPRNNSENQAGWNRFRQQTQAPQQRGGGVYNGGSRSQGSSQPGFQGRSGNDAPRTYSRPPLRFNKPIVSEPRTRSYGGNPGPSYQQRSAPSYRSAPRTRSAPSYHGNSGGGRSYSAPSRSSSGGGNRDGGGNRGGGGHRH
ncbi:MAG TPA: DUF6600 domain-containing protein [Terriglobia bacterium]|nr:DUF6600 domain-containing protein [Terriglobia bacterium]